MTVIIPEQLPLDMKKIYYNWLARFFSRACQGEVFNPYLDYQGEDKNILSWQSSEKYIKLLGQPPRH